MRVIRCIALAMICSPSHVHAQGPDMSPADMQRLSTELGVETATSTEGPVQVTTWTKNGVTITRRQNGSDVTVFGNDASREGAILCSRLIDIAIRAALDTCPSAEDAEPKQDIDQSITAIDEFIVANSLVPISLSDLRMQEAAQYDEAKRQTADKESAKVAEMCNANSVDGKLIAYFRDLSHGQRQSAVTDLLSIPRWPVLNPCM